MSTCFGETNIPVQPAFIFTTVSNGNLVDVFDAGNGYRSSIPNTSRRFRLCFRFKGGLSSEKRKHKTPVIMSNKS